MKTHDVGLNLLTAAVVWKLFFSWLRYKAEPRKRAQMLSLLGTSGSLLLIILASALAVSHVIDERNFRRSFRTSVENSVPHTRAWEEGKGFYIFKQVEVVGSRIVDSRTRDVHFRVKYDGLVMEGKVRLTMDPLGAYRGKWMDGTNRIILIVH